MTGQSFRTTLLCQVDMSIPSSRQPTPASTTTCATPRITLPVCTSAQLVFMEQELFTAMSTEDREAVASVVDRMMDVHIPLDMLLNSRLSTMVKDVMASRFASATSKQHAEKLLTR